MHVVHPRSKTWRRLLPGVAVSAALIGAAVLILVFARVGALHGDTVRYHLFTEDAGGVRPGSDVWLAGVRVGRVRSIRFRPAATDTLRRLAVDVDVLAAYQRFVRRDTRGSIRSGGRRLGEPVVWLQPGSTASPVLPPGGALAIGVEERPDLEPALDTLTRDYRSLSREWARVSDASAEANRRVHTAVGNPGWGTSVLEERLARLGRQSGMGKGVANSAAADPLQRARRVMTLADSLLDLLSAPNSAGAAHAAAARRETARSLNDLRRQLDRLQQRLASADGTAGRFAHDSALALETARLDSTMAALMKDVHKHPFRYWPF